MDWPSRVLTALEDRRVGSHHRRVARVLKEKLGSARTAGFVIREQAEDHFDREFLHFEDGATTFGAFNQGVNRYAHALKRNAVERGDVVAIMMENSRDLLEAQGAVAKLGAIGALINTSLRGQALQHVVAASGAKLLIADAACGAAVSEIASRLARECFSFDPQPGIRDLRSLLEESSDAECDIPDVGLGEIFLYIYTSGTTGYPKPAIVRHARFTLGGYSLAAILGLDEGDCIYAPTPLYHGYSNFVGFSPALHNASAFASRKRFSARHFLSDVRRTHSTHLLYVGEVCRYLLNQAPSDLDRAHSLRVASGPGLRPDVWRRFVDRYGIDRIIETYGQTEANVSLMNLGGPIGSIGRAAPGTHRNLRLVRFDAEAQQPIRDAAGRVTECAVGEVGELLSVVSDGTRMSFDGYVDRADNEEKLVRDCFEVGDLYLRTGDLMRRDSRSYYYFVDRVGDTFRWKGENVATMEVAEILNGAPGVAETAVYGVEVPNNEGRAGMALVVPADGATFEGRAYYRFAERTLPRYARPLFVRVSAAMDVTGTLKYSKRRLQAEGFDVTRVRDPVYFRDEAIGTYRLLCEEVLKQIIAGTIRV